MNVKNIENRVIGCIKTNRLITSGDKVLVAVSGGPDSIFLFNLLNRYKNELSIELFCCHINHNLRGEVSKKEETFVRNVSKSMGIQFVSRSVDVLSYSKEMHLSIEDAARKMRLKVLKNIADEINVQKIALGHTSDDSIETFFLNLFRGAGRKGLSGIKLQREIFIRPLLCISKKEITVFLKENNIDYRIDVTNWNRDYRRNFIRREIVPLIEEKINSNLKANILQLISVINNEEELLSKVTDEVIENICKKTEDGILVERDGFRTLKPALQRRVVMKCFEKIAGKNKSLKFKEIEALRNTISGTSSGLYFSYHKSEFFIGADTVLVRRSETVIEKAEKCDVVKLNIPGDVQFKECCSIITSVLKNINGNINDKKCVYFNLSEIHPPLVVRTRRNGDKFSPFGMNKKKKIKDFFIDEKVPFWERDKIPLVVDTKDILWIVGLRRSDLAKVGDKTERVLKIEERQIG